ncbi:unnamed protein product, partial [Ascophyllum nodosum]
WAIGTRCEVQTIAPVPAADIFFKARVRCNTLLSGLRGRATLENARAKSPLCLPLHEVEVGNSVSRNAPSRRSRLLQKSKVLCFCGPGISKRDLNIRKYIR